MAAVENFENWGISDLYFSVMAADGTYGTPHHQENAVSLSETPEESNNNRDAADNKEVFGSSSELVTFNLEVTKFDNWLKTSILGYIEEGDGLGIGDGTPKHFAMMVQNEGDEGPERSVWYDCTSSGISKTRQTTDVDGNYTFAHETVTITARKVTLPNDERRLGWSCSKGSTNYASFFTAVYYPAASNNG